MEARFSPKYSTLFVLGGVCKFFTRVEVAHMSLPGVTHSSLDLEWWKTHRGQPVPRWKSLLQPCQKPRSRPSKGVRTLPVDQRTSQVQEWIRATPRECARTPVCSSLVLFVNDGV